MEITLNDELGCVVIMPKIQVTFHVCTWLYSEQTANTAMSYSDSLSIIQAPDTDMSRHIKRKLI